VPASVLAFFDREVKPHVPDAWIDIGKRDPKDGRVGLIGYEINFNRYFYRYTPPRPLEEIEGEIRAIEQDILRLLAEVTGGGGLSTKRRHLARMCRRFVPQGRLLRCRDLLITPDVLYHTTHHGCPP